jgi:hypothetical protein
MAPKAEKADPVQGADLRNFDLAISSELTSERLNIQVFRLRERFSLPPDVAILIATLAWGAA